MRDKLIRMLLFTDYSNVEQNRPLMVETLNNLRCDKCKHWQSTAEVCRQLIGEDNNRVPTAPNFFCALWEPKQ